MAVTPVDRGQILRQSRRTLKVFDLWLVQDIYAKLDVFRIFSFHEISSMWVSFLKSECFECFRDFEICQAVWFSFFWLCFYTSLVGPIVRTVAIGLSVLPLTSCVTRLMNYIVDGRRSGAVLS